MIEQTLHQEIHALHVTDRSVKFAIIKKAFCEIILLDIIDKIWSSKDILYNLFSL